MYFEQIKDNTANNTYKIKAKRKGITSTSNK